MIKYDDTVSSQTTGQPIYGAQVTVLNAQGLQATIYSDEAGTIPLSQPILTDQSGYFSFYIDDGRYNVVVMAGQAEIARTNITMVDTLGIKQRALLVPVNEDGGTIAPADARKGMVLAFDAVTGAPSAVLPNAFAGPPGGSDSAFLALADLKGSDPVKQPLPRLRTGGTVVNYAYVAGDFTGRADDVNVVKLDAVPLTTGALVRQSADGITFTQGVDGAVPVDLRSINRQQVTGIAFGARNDGVTDDTAALTKAAAEAIKLGHALHLPGRYAVSNFELPGGYSQIPETLASYLNITGNPTFVQAVPNVPCLIIKPKAGSIITNSYGGYRLDCTVEPHPQSSKTNPANMAVNLTGLNAATATVRLGKCPTATGSSPLGRFHTVVYADCDNPFHYGNTIYAIGVGVPAPKYFVRYGNKGAGFLSNPNANKIIPFFYAMDTKPGDVLIDVTASTLSEISGPGIMESCPDVLGVDAGNGTYIHDLWPENIGVFARIVGGNGTVANHCNIDRCFFSGPSRITIAGDLDFPPQFSGNIALFNATITDPVENNYKPSLVTRARVTPPAPALSFELIGASASIIDAGVRHGVDHHGHHVWALAWTVTPFATGRGVIRLDVPAGYEIVTAEVGVETTSGPIPVALTADLTGASRAVAWASTGAHTLSVRVSAKAITY